MSAYLDELTQAMTMLGREPHTLFLGQGVSYDGPMHKTFAGVPAEKLIEFPVAEEMQLGASIGLSLEGFLPVSCFPRWNFLLLAANQLVNHLDRLPLYSDYRPNVIIRTAIGRHTPLDPGPQHQDDFSEAFIGMLRTITVTPIIPWKASDAYRWRLCDGGSHIIVEDGNLY